MEEDLANLHIIDDEEDAFKEAAAIVEEDYKFCVVGRCLTDNAVHVRIDSSCVTFGWDASLLASMKRRMAGLSRWLREPDGSIISKVEKESGVSRSNSRDDGNHGRFLRDGLVIPSQKLKS
ncbi:hypothetical protein Gogos_009808 [Gossypium gossypioides]|uniref:Uncharacterized protein n=1 Tax=Gossypium gossypioides TaxID=34282 RepID=A0A7J9BJ82_GOSGO|nr:hypothetical protein [Gossypium gossypioides]